MLHHRVFLHCAMVALLAFSGDVAAQDFMTTAQAARILADGRPWDAVAPDGRKARLTFNADGTGSFEGPVTMSTTWAIKADDLCIDLRVAGTRCLRFKPVQGGLQAYRGAAADLRLTR